MLVDNEVSLLKLAVVHVITPFPLTVIPPGAEMRPVVVNVSAVMLAPVLKTPVAPVAPIAP